MQRLNSCESTDLKSPEIPRARSPQAKWFPVGFPEQEVKLQKVKQFFGATCASVSEFLSKVVAPVEVKWLCEGFKEFMQEFELEIEKYLESAHLQEHTLSILYQFQEWSQRVYCIQTSLRGGEALPLTKDFVDCYNFLQKEISFEKLKVSELSLHDLHQLKISYELKKIEQAPACCKFKTQRATYNRLDTLREFFHFCRDNQDQIFKNKVYPNETPLSQRIRLYHKHLSLQ